MPKASDNEYPSVLFTDGTTNASTPAADTARLFFKSGKPYYINDQGSVIEFQSVSNTNAPFYGLAPTGTQQTDSILSDATSGGSYASMTCDVVPFKPTRIKQIKWDVFAADTYELFINNQSQGSLVASGDQVLTWDIDILITAPFELKLVPTASRQMDYQTDPGPYTTDNLFFSVYDWQEAPGNVPAFEIVHDPYDWTTVENTGSSLAHLGRYSNDGATNIEIDLPAGYLGFEIRGKLRSSFATTDDWGSFAIRFGDPTEDSGASSYGWHTMWHSGTAGGENSSSADDQIIGYASIVGDSEPDSNLFGPVNIEVMPGYDGASEYTEVLWYASSGGTDTNRYSGVGGGHHMVAQSNTKMYLYAAGNDTGAEVGTATWIAGSYVDVYAHVDSNGHSGTIWNPTTYTDGPTAGGATAGTHNRYWQGMEINNPILLTGFRVDSNTAANFDLDLLTADYDNDGEIIQNLFSGVALTATDDQEVLLNSPIILMPGSYALALEHDGAAATWRWRTATTDAYWGSWRTINGGYFGAVGTGAEGTGQMAIRLIYRRPNSFTQARLAQPPIKVRELVFSIPGTLAIGIGALRHPVTSPQKITAVRVICNTAPTGSDVIFDVNINGFTAYTTQSNRPTITAGTNGGGASLLPDVVQLAAGDFLTIDVDQIGSTVAGENATILLETEGTT